MYIIHAKAACNRVVNAERKAWRCSPSNTGSIVDGPAWLDVKIM